jgi:hypothetical protein
LRESIREFTEFLLTIQPFRAALLDIHRLIQMKMYPAFQVAVEKASVPSVLKGARVLFSQNPLVQDEIGVKLFPALEARINEENASHSPQNWQSGHRAQTTLMGISRICG